MSAGKDGSLTIRSTARCLYSEGNSYQYFLNQSNSKGILNQRSPPNLSLDAKNWIVEMNTNYGKGVNITNDIFDFIEYFGTHIVRYANMRTNECILLSLYFPAISSLELDSLTSSRWTPPPTKLCQRKDWMWRLQQVTQDLVSVPMQKLQWLKIKRTIRLSSTNMSKSLQHR